MLMLIIYLRDKDKEECLSIDDRNELSKIEIACTKCFNNWRMPYRLRA